MLNEAGGRKFILSVIILVIFTIFVVLDKMTAEQFITAVLINLGIFSGANVIQKLKEIEQKTNL